MSIIKGILIYTAIFLGLVLGVGVILIGIMYFFPQVSVFGYKFYHGNNDGKIYEVVAEDNTGVGVQNLVQVDGEVLRNIDAVEIVANKWDIEVLLYEAPDNNVSFFRVEFTRSITGFIKDDSQNPNFKVEATKKALTGESVEKNVVTFNVVEPEGAYFNRGAKIVVWIPDTLGGGNLNDIRIQSGSGEINFGQKSVAELIPVGNPEINVENFYLKDGSNDATINHINILNSLNIDATNSNFNIDKDLNCDVNINCDKGKYHFENVTGTNKEVNINVVNADVQFANIDGNVTLKSDYGYFRADTISGNFSSLSHDVDDIKNACDLKIGTIKGTVYIQNDSGNIKIGQVGQVETNSTDNDLRIDTYSGDVTISKCFAKSIIITSTSGVINLGQCLGSLDITTQNGSVYVDFMTTEDTVDGVTASAIENAVENLNNKPIKISTGVEKGNGAIEVKNTRGQLTLESNGRGKIYALVDYIPDKSQNVVKAHNGNVDLIVPDSSQFWLAWRGVSSAKIHIVDFESTEKKYTSYATNTEIFDKDMEGVFVGGAMNKGISTHFEVDANKNLTIYSKLHAQIS